MNTTTHPNAHTGEEPGKKEEERESVCIMHTADLFVTLLYFVNVFKNNNILLLLLLFLLLLLSLLCNL